MSSQASYGLPNKILFAVFLLSSSLLGTSHAAWDQRLAAIEAGSKTYYRFCSICHGIAAKGNGSFAQNLKTVPPDLTILAQTNDGAYPWLRLYETIDGNNTTQAHGTTEMPIWGNQFNLKNWASGQSEFADAIVRGRIFELLVYLESIQER